MSKEKPTRKSGIKIKRPRKSGVKIKRPSKEASKVNEQDIAKFLGDVYDYMEGLKVELVGGATADTVNYFMAAIDSMEGEQDYSEALEIVRQNREDFARKHKASAAIAGVIGGLASGAGIAGFLTKGAMKTLSMVAPKLLKSLPQSVQTAGSLAGTTATGAIEAGISEQARTGEEGAFAKGAKVGAMWGGALGTPMAFLKKKKALESSYRSLGPSKTDWKRINENKKAAEKAASIAKQLIDFDVVRFYRSKAKMNEILKGSRKLEDHLTDDLDSYSDLDIADISDRAGGIIGEQSEKLDSYLGMLQKNWHKAVNSDKATMREMYNDYVQSGVYTPEQATRRVQAMKDGAIIFGDELKQDAVQNISEALKNKRMQFINPSARANMEQNLEHLKDENYGLTLPEAQSLKKTIGKMILDTNWAQLPPESTDQKNILKEFYSTLKSHIEDSAESAGRMADIEGAGDVVKKANKELGGLLGAGKILDSSSASDKTRKTNLFAVATAGTLGGGLATLVDPSLSLLGSAVGLAGKMASDKYGPQTMSQLHQHLGTQMVKGGVAVGAQDAAGLLMPQASAEEPQFIPRKTEDLKLHLPLIKSIVEQEAPHLATELINSAMHDDDETFIQILSDISPEIENFVEQPPLKIKNIPIKSSYYSPTHKGEIRVGNKAEKNIVVDHIMNKEDITQKEKLAMVSKFIETGTIAPEKPKEQQVSTPRAGASDILKEQRLATKNNPQVS